MANPNPKGRGDVVGLDLPPKQVRFLRDLFERARAGVRDELRDHPGSAARATTLRREEAAYGRLLAALDVLAIVPDRDIRDLLRDLAEIIDRGNEYKRVVEEHEAMHGLLTQLVGGEVW